MIKFKDFLILKEELNLEEKREVKTWKRDPEALLHTDHYFGKGNDEVNTQLEGTQNKSEIHKKIERHLGQEIHPEDYKSGITKDKYNRDVKIGSLLTKNKAPQDLINSFVNDNTRQGKKFTGLTIKTTRSPEGVAGQTSRNQSWENESCKNFNTGSNRHYLKHEVEHGTVVSYLHDHTGKEIARATLHPHINDEGHRAYAVDSHYGIDHAGFKEHVNKIAEQLSGSHKGGSLMYKKHPDVYDDNGENAIIHPNVDEKTINDRYEEHLKNNSKKSKDLTEKSLLLQHPKIHEKHLDNAINRLNLNLIDNYDFNDIIKNPSLTSNHIFKLMDKIKAHDATHYGTRLMRHSYITKEHIDKALKLHDHPEIKHAAILHKNATKEHIHQYLDDPNVKSIDKGDMFRYSKGDIRKEHIDKALKTNNPEIKHAAILHKNATKEHIHQYLDDPNVKSIDKGDMFRYSKGDIRKEHIDKALKTNDPDIKHGVNERLNRLEGKPDEKL